MKDIIIPVKVGGITFKNPFYVASGPTTKSVKQLKRIEETGWAAASIKLTIDPAPYINRKPRYAIFEDRNALGFTTEKRLTFEEGLKLVEDAKKELTDLLVFANITYAGDAGVAGWVNMAKKFEETGADVVELNMCCPNMSYNIELTTGDSASSAKKTGASLGQQGEAVADIVREIKKAIGIPLFVKLTPEGGQIAKVAKALFAAGADAVGGTANRLGIPPIDIENPSRAIYHLQDEISMTCHCGAWLKPLAQRDVYEIRKVSGTEPVVTAAGGVRNWKDAVELILCGTNLVGVCAETLISGYDIVRPMIKGLKEYMDTHKYSDLSQFRGMVVPEVKTALEVTLYGGYASIKNPDLAAPCTYSCPHHVPAQAYVQKVAKGEFEDAYRLVTSKGPLQSICAWVCSSPCEDSCTRGINGDPVRIREIKRFVLEYGRSHGFKPDYRPSADHKEKIAVVGSGPAGLSCAFDLAKAGYKVTVFERKKKAGGMLRYGLPSFRMESAMVDEQITLLLDMGVVFQYGKELGKDFSLADLRGKEFSAIFVAVGAQESKKLLLENSGAEGCMDALGFLRKVNEKEEVKVGERTVVLGGGFTAVDAARTALRLGSREVILAYQRTRREMPASEEEISEAEAEGVKIMYLVAPEAFTAERGKITGVVLKNQVLGEIDNSKRRKPEAVRGAVFTLPCDTVIMAVGQSLEEGSVKELSDRKGSLEIDEKTCATSIPGVFCGGDIIKVESIISAISMGNRAAAGIDKYIKGSKATIEFPREFVQVDTDTVLKRMGYYKDEKTINPLEMRVGAERKRDFLPYTRGFTQKEAQEEASRCFNCGCGEGCQICKTICCDFAPFIEGIDRLAINKEDCVACGMCFNLCPNKNIEMISTGEKV